MEIILPEDKSLHFYGKFYKFLGVDSAIKTLKSGTLKFSNPTTFNDPLDCSKYLFDFKISDSELFSKPETAYGKLFSNTILKEKCGLSMDDLLLKIDPVINFKTFNGVLDKNQRKELLQRITQELFAKENLEKYRITCFSKKYNSKKSFLMWSHYAESHKGICLEFDNRKETDLQELRRFTPISIIYQHELPKIQTQLDFESNNWIWVKSRLFKYENEVRLIRKMNKSKPNSFFAFPKEYLTKIIFGVNTTIDTIQTVKGILYNQYDIDGIYFEKMNIDKRCWQLASYRYDINSFVTYKI